MRPRAWFDKLTMRAAHDGHVFGAEAASVTGEIIAERDIEQPVHAFDAPVSARAVGEALDIEGGGRDVEPRVLRAAVLEFGSIDDLYDGFDVIEPRLPGIGLSGFDPVNGF